MPGGSAGAGAGGSPGGMGVGGGMGGMMPGGGRGRTGGTASVEAPTYDVGVELFGLVYIYNPPNESKLGATQTAAGAVPAAGATSAAAPPAAPRS